MVVTETVTMAPTARVLAVTSGGAPSLEGWA